MIKGPRRSKKTTALVNYAARLHGEQQKVVVITSNANEATLFAPYAIVVTELDRVPETADVLVVDNLDCFTPEQFYKFIVPLLMKIKRFNASYTEETDFIKFLQTFDNFKVVTLD